MSSSLCFFAYWYSLDNYYWPYYDSSCFLIPNSIDDLYNVWYAARVILC